ncbi:MAG TPA: hypothetical protein PL157_12595, partial [Acidobacteriota bacterium]|nr:hypothetical protein [Acidobacteriota bacterium]
ITYLKEIIEKVWLASTISSGIFLETKQSRGFPIITVQSGSTCNRNRTLCNSKATFDPEFLRRLRKKWSDQGENQAVMVESAGRYRSK